jgi:sucrose phosphorylase
MHNIEQGLKTEVVNKQLEIIRLRNTSNAFSGEVEINDAVDSVIDIKWVNGSTVAHLKANLQTKNFTIDHTENGLTSTMHF